MIRSTAGSMSRMMFDGVVMSDDFSRRSSCAERPLYSRLPVKTSYITRSERVQIALNGRRAAFEQLRRHVRGRARDVVPVPHRR